MSRKKRKIIVLSSLMLLVSLMAFAIVKRHSIFWRLKMYLGKDITESTIKLPDAVRETSGLLYWNDLLWTQNDHRSPFLYALEPKTGVIKRSVKIKGIKDYDWEDITQDENYIYIGDFGDNDFRHRKVDKSIFIISKKDLEQNDSVDYAGIGFELEDYANDRDYKTNNTNFDCEAFIALGDSLYLFTKEWKTQQTSVYVLPKEAGCYQAKKIARFDTDGLVTGATYLPDKNILALCGYNTDMKSYLAPFVYLFSQFKGNDFFGGKSKKIFLGKPFHQVEGIATNDGFTYYFTNEGLVKDRLGIPPLLMRANLGKYLSQSN